MYNIDIYNFLEKIQNIKSDTESNLIIKDLILDLSKETENKDLVIEILNMEKINSSFFKKNTCNASCKKKEHFCTICQEYIKKGEHKIKLCNCGHIFHKKCLNKYLKMQRTNFECPVCRESYKKMLYNIAENNCEL